MGTGSSLVIPELKSPQDTIVFRQRATDGALFQHGGVAEEREERAAIGSCNKGHVISSQ